MTYRDPEDGHPRHPLPIVPAWAVTACVAGWCGLLVLLARCAA